MGKVTFCFLIVVFLLSCKNKVQKVKPSIESISESIYASGILKSRDQYQAYAPVNGIIDTVYVSEGELVKKGTPILLIAREIPRLNKENAELTADYFDLNANLGKLNDAKLLIDLSRNKMKNDSLMFLRQKILWDQEIGTKVEFEQRDLAYQTSRSAYISAMIRYNDLKRQLEYNSSQSKKNAQISGNLAKDYMLRSEIDGIVYSINKIKGELVGAQSPLAVIGDAGHFILEMQVDEYDILKLRLQQPVLVTLDSYKGKVFEARVTKIYPLMNDRSKTFLVDAEFLQPPAILYPNISFEANIVIASKEKAMLIPRDYIFNDSIVIKSDGVKVVVKTGLKDYRKIEILSGITAETELINPAQ